MLLGISVFAGAKKNKHFDKMSIHKVMGCRFFNLKLRLFIKNYDVHKIKAFMSNATNNSDEMGKRTNEADSKITGVLSGI